MPEPATPSGDRVREAVERLRETATSAGMSAGEVQALLDDALRADASTLRARPGADVAPTIAAPGSAIAAPAGRDLGRYRVLHELGHGGMGVVYRAHDEMLGRDVALKVLLVGDRIDRELLDRFQREVRAAAAMDHPHIVKVLDVGELPSEREREPGKPFYTMELLSGEDLAHAIGGGSITPRDAVEVTRQVALALAYAHGRGVLHRDVKPQNIFLRAEAPSPPPSADAPTVQTVAARAASSRTLHALLVDFGLAKFVEREYAGGEDQRRAEGLASLTQSGQVLGTPVYMAPEQMRGAREVDARADVYALGATLYHMLTGQPPITGNSLGELLLAVQEVEPISPRKRNARVDRDVETLCLRCLAKDPAGRYATAADLAEDARRYLAGEPLVARPVGRAARLARLVRRHLVISTLTAGLTVFAVLLLWNSVGPARVTLQVVPPNARVSANGKPFRSGDWVWPAGELQFRIEATGFETKLVTVEVPHGSIRTLAPVVLVPDRGFLTVASDPPAAAVWIDDADTGKKTPIERIEVKNGSHTLQLRLADHDDWVDAVTIQPGPPLDLGMRRLVHERGTLVLDGSPRGVTIDVFNADGSRRITSLSPPVEVPLDTGRYLLRAESEDCFGDEKEIEVNRGVSISANMSLAAKTVWSAHVERDDSSGRVMLGDLDRDGHLDVVRVGSRLEVVSGRDGSILWGAASGQCALGDVNGDGGLDCVVCTKSRIVALSGANGVELWRHPLGDEWPSPPAIADVDLDGCGDCILMFYPSRVCALSGKDGHPIWEREAPQYSRLRPATVDVSGDGNPDCVFGPMEGPFALDGRTGDVLWAIKRPGEGTGSNPCGQTPAVVDLDGDGDLECVLFLDQVLALDARTGEVVWQRAMERRSSGPWTPPPLGDLNDDGVLDCVIVGDKLYALSGKDGSVLWERPDLPMEQSPVLADVDGDGATECVAVGQLWEEAPGKFDGMLWVLSGRDGRVRWSVDDLRATSYFLPTLGDMNEDGRLEGLFAEPGRVRSIRIPSSRPLWSFHPRSALGDCSDLIELNGDHAVDCVVIAGDELIAVSGYDGARIWSHQFVSFVPVSRPIPADIDLDGAPDFVIAGRHQTDALHGGDGTEPSKARLDLGVAQVRAFSGRDGSELWAVPWPEDGPTDPECAALGTSDWNADGYPDVLAAGKSALVLSGKDGALLWKNGLPPPFQGGEVGGMILHLVDLDADKVLDWVVSPGRSVYARSGANGSLLWAQSESSWYSAAAMADVNGDGVADCIVGLHEDQICAFSGRDGSPLWSRAMPERADSHAPLLVQIDGDGVPDCVVSVGRLFALSGKDGSVLWTSGSSSSPPGQPVVADLDRDGAFECVVWMDGGLLVLSALDGAPLYRLDTGDVPASPLACADLDGDGVLDVLARTSGGAIVALHGARPPTPRVAGDSTPAMVADLALLDRLRVDGRWRRLIEASRTLIERTRDRWTRSVAWSHIGNACVCLGQFAEALRAFREASALGLPAPEDAVGAWLASVSWRECPPVAREEAVAGLGSALLANPDGVFDAMVERRESIPRGASGAVREMLREASRSDRGCPVVAILSAVALSNGVRPWAPESGLRETLQAASDSLRERMGSADERSSARRRGYLALAADALGDREGFALHYEHYRALSSRPSILSTLLLEANDPDGRAETAWRQARDAEVAGNAEESLVLYEASLSSRPEDVGVMASLATVANGLAWRLAGGEGQAALPSGSVPPLDPARAVRLAKRAVECARKAGDWDKDPENSDIAWESGEPLPAWAAQRGYTHAQVLAMYLDTLAVGYATRDGEGDLDRAIQAEEEALGLGPDPDDAKEFEARLQEYRAMRDAR